MTDFNAKSSLDIQLEVRMWREAQQAMLRRAKALTGPPMLAAMRDLVLGLQSKAKANAPEDTRRLKNSILPDVAMIGPQTVQGVAYSDVEYSLYMEEGASPHWPPIEPLVGWVHRKHLAGVYRIQKPRRRLGSYASQYREDLRVAFFVARKMKDKGLKARLFLERAWKDNMDRLLTDFSRAIGRMIQ